MIERLMFEFDEPILGPVGQVLYVLALIVPTALMIVALVVGMLCSR